MAKKPSLEEMEKRIKALEKEVDIYKKAAETFQEGEEKYRNFFDNALVGMFRTRISDGKVLDCNDRFAINYGYKSREECIDKFVVSDHYVDPGTRKRLMIHLRENGEINNFEAYFYRKDGAIIYVRFYARLYPERGYMEGVGFDITDQKLAEEALRKSEERYRTILESIEEAYFELDLKGSFTFFNESM
ncbi:PAS domain-containing protein, partial [Thermodesulfobacteriota bacterium]